MKNKNIQELKIWPNTGNKKWEKFLKSKLSKKLDNNLMTS